MVMRTFAEELKRSYLRNKREITIIYSNSRFCHVFEEAPCWIVTPVEDGLRMPAAIIRLREGADVPCALTPTLSPRRGGGPMV